MSRSWGCSPDCTIQFTQNQLVSAVVQRSSSSNPQKEKKTVFICTSSIPSSHHVSRGGCVTHGTIEMPQYFPCKVLQLRSSIHHPQTDFEQAEA